jgi:hypothetical protein
MAGSVDGRGIRGDDNGGGNVEAKVVDSVDAVDGVDEREGRRKGNQPVCEW